MPTNNGFVTPKFTISGDATIQYANVYMEGGTITGTLRAALCKYDAKQRYSKLEALTVILAASGPSDSRRKPDAYASGNANPRRRRWAVTYPAHRGRSIVARCRLATMY